MGQAGDERPAELHKRLERRYAHEAEERDASAGRLSLVQLVLFLAACVLGGAGGAQGSALFGSLGALSFVLFLAVRTVQARILSARDAARTRAGVHERHLLRLKGDWHSLPTEEGRLLAPEHPYASDLDLVGAGSLLQRIDVTHTRRGKQILARWLGAPADEADLIARQEAIAELAGRVELRQELEAAVLDTGADDLDAGPFLEFTLRPGLFDRRAWLRPLALVLPAITLTLLLLGQLEILPAWPFVIPLIGSFLILRSTGAHASHTHGLLSSRKGFVESFAKLLLLVEETSFTSPLLKELKERLRIGGERPSAHMRRLERYVGFFDVRSQGLLHVFLNPLTLWDLNCLAPIERWNKEVGREADKWFTILGEIEALAALATLLHQDPAATIPEIVPSDQAFEAEGLAHPLLPPDARVANDLALRGPGSALIVTGSNMAGKSTLLRAVGLNIALALAGGPVTAKSMRVPRVRLRASMRVADSLQRGASYFQAELSRLRVVVGGADREPPLFFLLDELLRGTNARARHRGARAVVRHLLDRRASGLVATHDIALSELEEERPGKVENIHFTDVILDGEMTFDYKLRPGVVKTSNALRLLAQVGVEVEADDRLFDEEMPALEERSRPSEPLDEEE